MRAGRVDWRTLTASRESRSVTGTVNAAVSKVELAAELLGLGASLTPRASAEGSPVRGLSPVAQALGPPKGRPGSWARLRGLPLGQRLLGRLLGAELLLLTESVESTDAPRTGAGEVIGSTVAVAELALPSDDWTLICRDKANARLKAPSVSIANPELVFSSRSTSE